MTKPGRIELKDNKVIFVYYELSRPKVNDFFPNTGKSPRNPYIKAMKEYEASKRSAEVNNIAWRKSGENRKYPYIHNIKGIPYLEHNQPCEAEVTDGKATIVKIL